MELKLFSRFLDQFSIPSVCSTFLKLPPNSTVQTFQEPVYIEQSCPGRERESPSQPSQLQRETLTSLREPRADSSACACSDCLALMQLTELTPKCSYGEKLTLPSKKGDPARWVTLIAEPTLFCSSCSCEQIAKFVRKCRKRWFAQGSSGISPSSYKRGQRGVFQYDSEKLTFPARQTAIH